MVKPKTWRKLFVFVLIVGMFSTGVTGYWGYRNAKESLERGALEHLVSIRDIKQAKQLAPGTFLIGAAAQTDAANIKLVTMEKQAFELGA